MVEGLGVPEAIRTPDLHLRRVPLYPAELQGRNLQLIILITITTIIIGLLSILLGSRAFCRYICPQGVFLTIGSKLGRKIKIPSLQLKSNYHNCSNCKLCDKSCPMGLDVNQMVINSTMDDLNCILCGECIEKCPKDAISYSYGAKD